MKLAIFDMDGLLFDTERLTKKKLGEVMAKYGYSLDEEAYLKIVGVNSARYREIMIKLYGEKYPHDKISSQVREEINRSIRTDGAPVKKGIPELLGYLKGEGIKCAVASSTKSEYVKEYIAVSKLDKYFDLIIGGDMIARSKPFPDIFLKVCEELNIKPQDSVVFEDSENGIRAAVSGGIPVICIFDIKRHDKNITDMCLTCADNALDVIEYLKHI